MSDAAPPAGCLQVVRAEAKDIWFDNASRAKLQAGINKVADAVGVTLGPRGAAPCALCPMPCALCPMPCAQAITVEVHEFTLAMRPPDFRPLTSVTFAACESTKP